MRFDKLSACAASAVCHGLPGRSLSVGGAPLPFCARCSGLYMGAFIAFLFICVKKRFAGNALPRPFVIGAAVLLTPLMIDGFSSFAGFWEGNNLLRLLTGLPYGVVLPFLLTLAANFKPEHSGGSKIIIKSNEFIMLLLIAAAAGAALYAGITGRRAALFMICAGAVSLFYCFFYMLVNLLPYKIPAGVKRTAAALSPFALFLVLNAVRVAAGV